MEQKGLIVKDLEPMIGKSNRVYEVLNRKRSLTLKMIRKLHQELSIPDESLIKQSVQTNCVYQHYAHQSMSDPNSLPMVDLGTKPLNPKHKITFASLSQVNLTNAPNKLDATILTGFLFFLCNL